jgi:hypothetical protein
MCSHGHNPIPTEQFRQHRRSRWPTARPDAATLDESAYDFAVGGVAAARQRVAAHGQGSTSDVHALRAL